MHRSVAENVARLSQWQKEQLNGDSFDFDYHLMWDHILNPGYHEIARILHKDMANLDKIGLNGMMSCQGQRTFFPTGLPFYSMAAALWDKEKTFEDVCKEYFTAAFGEDGAKVEAYLTELDRLFDPVYLRHEKEPDHEYYGENMKKVAALVDSFLPEIEAKKDLNPSWEQLSVHAEIVKKHAEMLTVFLGVEDAGKEARDAARDAMKDYLFENESRFLDTFDINLYNRIFGRYLMKFHDDRAVVNVTQ
jgi:hypothetical protein